MKKSKRIALLAVSLALCLCLCFTVCQAYRICRDLFHAVFCI